MDLPLALIADFAPDRAMQADNGVFLQTQQLVGCSVGSRFDVAMIAADRPGDS
jgi:hypothetical protein